MKVCYISFHVWHIRFCYIKFQVGYIRFVISDSVISKSVISKGPSPAEFIISVYCTVNFGRMLERQQNYSATSTSREKLWSGVPTTLRGHYYSWRRWRRTKAKFESEVVREWTARRTDGAGRTVCLTGRGKVGGGDSQTGNEMRGGQGLSWQFLLDKSAQSLNAQCLADTWTILRSWNIYFLQMDPTNTSAHPGLTMHFNLN